MGPSLRLVRRDPPVLGHPAATDRLSSQDHFTHSQQLTIEVGEHRAAKDEHNRIKDGHQQRINTIIGKFNKSTDQNERAQLGVDRAMHEKQRKMAEQQAQSEARLATAKEHQSAAHGQASTGSAQGYANAHIRQEQAKETMKQPLGHASHH